MPSRRLAAAQPQASGPPAPKPAPHLRRVSAAELPASRARAAAGAAPAAERNGHVSPTTANRPARPGPGTTPSPRGLTSQRGPRQAPRRRRPHPGTRTGKGTGRKRKAPPPPRFPRGRKRAKSFPGTAPGRWAESASARRRLAQGEGREQPLGQPGAAA